MVQELDFRASRLDGIKTATTRICGDAANTLHTHSQIPV